MAGLDSYVQELSAAKEDLKQSLAGGTDSAFAIGVKRRTAEIMAEDLRVRPQEVARYDNRKDGVFSGATLWRVNSQKSAAAPFSREQLTPSEFSQKNEEYLKLVKRIRQLQALDSLFLDKQRGIAYLTQENDKVREALTDIVKALSVWVSVHSSDPDFLTTSAEAGLLRMLDERQDLVAMLRLAQALPKDLTVSRIPIDRPALVEVVEVAVSLIPVVGSAVALFESVTGRDLFGYELDPLDRSILAAGALLPVASRLVKGGRILYTAARMERLYGTEAARWSIALASAERVAADTAAVQAFKKADAAVKAHLRVDARLAKEVVDGLERLGLKRVPPAVSPLPDYVTAALKRLISGKSFLSELDELALQRVIDKGPNVNLMKGQLLEELLESRIAGWLRDPAGTAALGIDRLPQGIEFIPGHMIRDTAGRQITDGILARRGGDALEIVAIFEAKGGASAARELKLTSQSISDLSIADRAELRAVARDEFRSLRSQARRDGRPFPTKQGDIDDAISKIEREIVQSEKGGQVRRDIERLHENEDGTLVRIVVGTEVTAVRVSPKNTKIFGVLPKNVKLGNMEQELQQLGYNFEALGMNVTDKELIDLTQDMRLLVTPP